MEGFHPLCVGRGKSRFKFPTGRQGLWPRSDPARVSTGRSGRGTDRVFVDGGVAEVLQLGCVLVEVRQMSVSSSGEPRCRRKTPMNGLGFSKGWMVYVLMGRAHLVLLTMDTG